MLRELPWGHGMALIAVMVIAVVARGELLFDKAYAPGADYGHTLLFAEQVQRLGDIPSAFPFHQFGLTNFHSIPPLQLFQLPACVAGRLAGQRYRPRPSPDRAARRGRRPAGPGPRPDARARANKAPQDLRLSLRGDHPPQPAHARLRAPDPTVAGRIASLLVAGPREGNAAQR